MENKYVPQVPNKYIPPSSENKLEMQDKMKIKYHLSF